VSELADGLPAVRGASRHQLPGAWLGRRARAFGRRQLDAPPDQGEPGCRSRSSPFFFSSRFRALCAGYASIQARRGHIGIEAIVGLLSPKVNHWRQLAVDVVSFLFCAFFSWKSWVLLDEAWVEGFHSESTWGPPLWIPYSLMTVGMTLLSLQILLQVVTGLRRRPQ